MQRRLTIICYFLQTISRFAKLSILQLKKLSRKYFEHFVEKNGDYVFIHKRKMFVKFRVFIDQYVSNMNNHILITHCLFYCLYFKNMHRDIVHVGRYKIEGLCEWGNSILLVEMTIISRAHKEHMNEDNSHLI